jgi:hypothetical protein
MSEQRCVNGSYVNVPWRIVRDGEEVASGTFEAVRDGHGWRVAECLPLIAAAGDTVLIEWPPEVVN